MVDIRRKLQQPFNFHQEMVMLQKAHTQLKLSSLLPAELASCQNSIDRPCAFILLVLAHADKPMRFCARHIEFLSTAIVAELSSCPCFRLRCAGFHVLQDRAWDAGGCEAWKVSIAWDQRGSNRRLNFKHSHVRPIWGRCCRFLPPVASADVCTTHEDSQRAEARLAKPRLRLIGHRSPNS